jgi:hypothetical protein
MCNQIFGERRLTWNQSVFTEGLRIRFRNNALSKHVCGWCAVSRTAAAPVSQSHEHNNVQNPILDILCIYAHEMGACVGTADTPSLLKSEHKMGSRVAGLNINHPRMPENI